LINKEQAITEPDTWSQMQKDCCDERMSGPCATTMSKSEGFALLISRCREDSLVEINLPLKKELRVRDVKESIFKQLGVEPSQQSLYFKKKGLPDTATLEECGLRSRDVLQGSLMGGEYTCKSICACIEWWGCCAAESAV